MIRDLQLADLEVMEKFPRDFELPNLSSKLIFAQRVVEFDKRVAAVGLLKLTTEASILANPDISSTSRALAIKSLIFQLIHDAERNGLDDCHVFLKPENYKMRKFLAGFNFVSVEDSTMYLPPRSSNGEKSNAASTRSR